jgi:hypothetical protein
MKHLKLFEGFYSDRLEEVMRELRAHMKEDLIDWKNVFSDEINHPVKMIEPYISSSPEDGEESIVCSIWIGFSKTKPTDEELIFICNTFLHIKNTLKNDYKIEATWSDIFDREYDLINLRRIKNNITDIKEILEISIFFTGK